MAFRIHESRIGVGEVAGGMEHIYFEQSRVQPEVAMNRRQFLLASAAAAAIPALGLAPGRLFAAPVNTPRLLVVFLRGGYDANNLLVPYGSDFYYQSRPKLAIAKPRCRQSRQRRRADGHWGLAPTVKDTMKPLWDRKQVAFIPFSGTTDLAQSLRNAGQYRGRRTGRPFDGAAFGVPGAAVGGDEARIAHRFHRLPAAFLPGRRRYPEHLAARRRQGRLRRPSIGVACRHVPRHAARAGRQRRPEAPAAGIRRT